MRAILVNIIIFMAIIGAYYIDFFGWFTSRYAFWGALALVAVVFIIAIKVLGNPFAGGDDDDNKKVYKIYLPVSARNLDAVCSGQCFC